MCRFAVVLLISCLVLPATAARAAELEGFGPIKFGMTKEEAWAAIDGKGEWKSDVALVYGFSIDGGTIALEAWHSFVDGRAADAVVWYKTAEGAPETQVSCREKTMIIAGLIRERYNKIPLAHYDAKEKRSNDRSKDFAIFDTVLFNFPRGAYIKISSILYLLSKEDHCQINVRYRPPTEDKIPF